MTRTKTRALANQPNNEVSVLDYGAVGDGVTDDTAAIQAAVDSLGTTLNGGTIYFPTGSYVVTSQIYTELFGDGDTENWSINLKGDSKQATKILLRNHDGFFQWNLDWTWQSTEDRSGRNNITFSATDFTVELEASVLGDTLASGEIDGSCGQVFRLVEAGRGSKRFAQTTISSVDIQNHIQWETNPPQTYVSKATGPTDETVYTGNYATQGLFARGIKRLLINECNWAHSSYGPNSDDNQIYRPDAFEGVNKTCYIRPGLDIVECVGHGFKIGDPICFSGINGQVEHDVVWPPEAKNNGDRVSFQDDKRSYFVSSIDFTENQFRISTSYACLTLAQCAKIPAIDYPVGYPNLDSKYLGYYELFSNESTISCEVYPATTNVFLYEHYGHNITDNQFWGLRFGLREEAPFTNGSEGGTVANTTLYADTGMFSYSYMTEPGLTIEDVHFNCQSNGLYVVGRKAALIHGNVWYNSSYYDTGYTDIKFERVQDSRIDSILFWYGDKASRTNVSCDSECINITLQNCEVGNTNGVMFKVDPNCTGMKGSNNYLRGAGTLYEGPISTIHTSNLGCMLVKADNTNQTVSTGSDFEPVVFQAVDYDPFNNHATYTDSCITIPSGYGINNVRFTAGVIASASANEIELEVVRHADDSQGLPYGMGGFVCDGSLFSRPIAKFSTGVIPVKAGDKFQLNVKQEGTAFDILANQNTFFSYEIVNG